VPPPDDSGSATTRDGRTLHYVSRGRGSPTVVFESGMGSSRSAWGAVLPVVAARTRAVAYDRAGLGRSPADPAPRTLDRAADDLADLLDHLGAGPFVLVGHSYGGPIVRLVTARATPGTIAGLVLVDQTDECCDLYYSPATLRQQRVITALLPAAARLGLLRLALARAGRALPPDDAADLRDEGSTVAAARAFRAEHADLTDDLRRLRDDQPGYPGVPVTLISGTRPVRVGQATRGALVEAHRRRAAALAAGRHVEAPRSGHLVMLTDPGVVAAEVLRIVDEVTDPAGPAGPPAR
jgi:pimeloyl-ACP methyl ester carboxylesterase